MQTQSTSPKQNYRIIIKQSLKVADNEVEDSEDRIMNVGQIKAFMGDQKAEQKAPADPNEAINKQLQQDGLKQAREFAQSQSASVTVANSQTTIGLRVFSANVNQNVVIDGKKPPQDHVDQEEKNASLFDFEEVAKNVMRFVGGVIQSAADSGADDDTLTSLFGQARDGVSRGIAMAKKDLAGMMNDEITEGISRSRDAIASEMNALEDRIFNRNEIVAEAASTMLGASDEKAGGLVIRTRDGDEVTLRFEDVKRVSIGAQSSAAYGSDEQGNTIAQTQQGFYFESYERSGISFSLEGELDEAEIEAIADLIGNTKDLADNFFSGDIDSAFEQALNLGFNETELVGFALQLNRTTSTEVVKTYENIKHYSEENEASGNYGSNVSPIAQYLDKMLSTFDDAGRQLASGDEYNNLITDLFNQLEEVQVPDLLSAINRFHSFNQTLLNNMPSTPTEKT